MRVLIDNTVLSNFALVRRPELLEQLLGTRAATTSQVMAEFDAGVERGRVPPTDWDWISILELSSTEQSRYHQLRQHLNAGEAACLSMAVHRQARVLTDDRDARVLAGQMQVSVSGTIGVLIRLVKTGQLTSLQADRLLEQMIEQGYYSPVETLAGLL